MTQKLGKTLGPFKDTSFIVIMLNREFNYTCREKKSFFISQDLHYSTELLREEIYDPGRASRKSKRHHVQITYGLTLGQELEKPKHL